MVTDDLPVSFQCIGGPGCRPQTWTGRLRILKEGNPCEAEVSARGSCFHLIVGKHVYGNYVCVPNWDVGTELSALDDLLWNEERLRNCTSLKKVDAVSVATALSLLGRYINK